MGNAQQDIPPRVKSESALLSSSRLYTLEAATILESVSSLYISIPTRIDSFLPPRQVTTAASQEGDSVLATQQLKRNTK
jgi:hypothetical protein